MNDTEIIEVVTSHKEGRKIQYRHMGDWMDAHDQVLWDFKMYEYRVSPEPRKPREWRIKFDEGSKEVKGITSAVEVPFAQNWILVREVLE